MASGIKTDVKTDLTLVTLLGSGLPASPSLKPLGADQIFRALTGIPSLFPSGEETTAQGNGKPVQLNAGGEKKPTPPDGGSETGGTVIKAIPSDVAPVTRRDVDTDTRRDADEHLATIDSQPTTARVGNKVHVLEKR